MPTLRTVRDLPEVGSARDQLRLMRSDRLGGLARFGAEQGDIDRFVPTSS